MPSLSRASTAASAAKPLASSQRALSRRQSSDRALIAVHFPYGGEIGIASMSHSDLAVVLAIFVEHRSCPIKIYWKAIEHDPDHHRIRLLPVMPPPSRSAISKPPRLSIVASPEPAPDIRSGCAGSIAIGPVAGANRPGSAAACGQDSLTIGPYPILVSGSIERSGRSERHQAGPIAIEDRNLGTQAAD